MLHETVYINQNILGGSSYEKKVDDHMIGLAYRYREEVKQQFPILTRYEPLTYNTQLVAGEKIEITIDIGNARRVVLSIFKDLQGIHTFNSVRSA